MQQTVYGKKKTTLFQAIFETLEDIELQRERAKEAKSNDSHKSSSSDQDSGSDVVFSYDYPDRD